MQTLRTYNYNHVLMVGYSDKSNERIATNRQFVCCVPCCGIVTIDENNYFESFLTLSFILELLNHNQIYELPCSEEKL